jgi:adenylate cyclase
VDGGFASRAAIEQFKTASPVPLHDLGVRDIRGRSGGIAVVGLAAG